MARISKQRLAAVWVLVPLALLLSACTAEAPIPTPTDGWDGEYQGDREHLEDLRRRFGPDDPFFKQMEAQFLAREAREDVEEKAALESIEEKSVAEKRNESTGHLRVLRAAVKNNLGKSAAEQSNDITALLEAVVAVNKDKAVEDAMSACDSLALSTLGINMCLNNIPAVAACIDAVAGAMARRVGYATIYQRNTAAPACRDEVLIVQLAPEDVRPALREALGGRR